MGKQNTAKTKRARKGSSSRGIATRQKPGESAPTLRARIKRLDREIVAQLSERAEAARQLAKHDNTSVDHAVVPPEVSRAVQWNKGPLQDTTVEAVFRELVSGCRSIVQAVRVAYLGPKYSYSYLAAVHRFGRGAELVPVSTIAAVFEEVDRHDAQFGLVPIENSTDGRIADTLDMFSRLPIRISGEVQLRIHHNLLGTCARDDVREVCSKPQALSQCRKWLAAHLPAARVVETASTTTAAEAAASRSGVAAIASAQAGVSFGLDILAAHIEDNPNNVTRFAIIGHASSAKSENDITSLMFQLEHQPGALADAMAIFKKNRLNMTWIESFPLRGSPNEYLFFVELEGYVSDLRVRRAITSLQRKAKRLEVLGSYPRTEPVD